MATPIERHFRAIVASPLGPLVLESNARALVRLALPGRDSRRPALLAGDKGDAIVEEAARQLQEYFAGQRREFDLPLEPTGTPFQRRVWRELCAIGFGQTISYGRLAARIGKPTGSRAVGAANGRNPIGLIVPCHRVIGADGSLTGYGGGLQAKAWLIRHEADVRAAAGTACLVS